MNSVVRMPTGLSTQGSWIQDANGNWVCSPCDSGGGQIPGCPPGFPPPGCPPWFSGMNSPPWYPGANAGVSFGQTPPANPVRGHFFYDGATLWIFDGAAWDAVGGVAAGGQTPPSTTPPSNPVPGTQWFNGVTLYVWDGKAWVPVSATKSTISSTAPPAPNPGDTWWDGTQMRIWDGSAWELVGPGATVGPTPTTTNTFAQTQQAAITGMVAGAWDIVAFTDTPPVDVQGAWDPVTKRVTPKVAGNYMVIARAYGSTISNGLAILKNDPGSFTSSGTENVLAIASSTAGGWMEATSMAHFNGSTDYMRLFFYPATVGTFYGLGGNPVMSLWLMP